MYKVLFNLSHNNMVANIILNQPKTYNALDLDMIMQLKRYFQEISNDQNIKLLVITANGNHFSTGGDLNWMQNAINHSKEENFQDVKKLADLFLELYNLNKPVICVVQGNVYGGGIGLVACSDIVIAVKNSKFCFSEVKLGLAPAIISEFVLTAMNIGFAKYSMLTAKPFNAEQAYQFGLVHQVVDNEELTKTLVDNIHNLLSLDFNGIITAKKLLRDKEPKISIEKLYSCVQTIADLRVSTQAQSLIKKFLHNSN